MSEAVVKDTNILLISAVLSAVLSFVGIIWLSLLPADLILHYSFGIGCIYAFIPLPFILIMASSMFLRKKTPLQTAILVSLYTTAIVSGIYMDKDWPSLQPARAFISRYLCPDISEIVIPWFMAPPREIAEQIVTGGVPIPWSSWLPSIIFWWVFAMVNGFYFLSINLIFRKRWIDMERLPFPQTELAYRFTRELVLTEKRGFSKPLILGVIAGFVFQFPIFMASIFPWFPDIYGWRECCWFGGRDLTTVFPGLTSNVPALGFINIHPLVAAISYVIPLTTLFNFWFWYLVYVILVQVAWYMGYYSGMESVNACCRAYMYYYYPPYKWPAVTMGAVLGIFIIYIVLSRGYIVNTFKAALGRLTEFEKTEPVPYKISFILLVVSFLAAVSLWSICGLSLPAALVMPTAMFIGCVIASRFVGTTGWPQGISYLIFYRVLFADVWSPWPPTREFGLAVYYAMHQGHWKGGGIPAVLGASAFRMSSAVGGDDRLVLKTYVISQVVAPLFSLLGFIWVLYTFGVSKIGLGPYDMTTEPLIRYLNPSRLETWPVPEPWIQNMLAGLIISSTLTVLHARFLWFPFEPIGFVLGFSLAGWGAYWGMALAAWVAKVLTLRIGGSKAYEDYGLPFVSGFAVGYVIALIIGGLLSVIRFFAPF